MASMALQGRLTRDPELRTTQSGVSVCSFTVAWSEKYKETETQLFLDCTA
jgi:Single-stranded DNA-binding protein